MYVVLVNGIKEVFKSNNFEMAVAKYSRIKDLHTMVEVIKKEGTRNIILIQNY